MLGAHPLRRRLSRFGAPHLLAALARAGVRGLSALANERRRLAGIGELCDSIQDYGRARPCWCPEGGLYERAPRAAAPFLTHGLAGVDMEALHLLILRAFTLRSGRESMMFGARLDLSDF